MSQLKPSVSGKPPSRKTPFQPAHALQYGLEVAMRDTRGAVCSVRCLFCRYFGREAAQKGKRKRTQNPKFYKPPYRPQNYSEHNTSAHPVKWAEYQALSGSDKLQFFVSLTSESNQLTSHYDGETSVLSFSFPKSIIEDLIGKIFSNAEDEVMSLMTALQVFGPVDNGAYNVAIKTPLRFTLAIQHLSVGLSFRQTSAVIQQRYRATGNPKLHGITDSLVSTYARILVAQSFQKIGGLMANSNM